MRKHMTYTAAAALLAGSVATSAFTAGSAAADETIRLTEKMMTVEEIDLGKAGPSVGDRFVYRSVLLGADGDRIGRGGGECVSIRPAHGGLGVTTCDAFLQIAGDQISYTGFYDLAAKRGTMPVVGGTGAYFGRTGALTWVLKSGMTTYEETIRLRG